MSVWVYQRPCRWRSPRRTTPRPKERSLAQLPRQLVQRRGRPGDGHRRRPRALPPEALALAVVLGPEPRGVDGPPVRGVRLPGLLPGHVERRRLQERQARPLPPEHQLLADSQRGGGLPVLLARRALPEAEVARPRPRALRVRSSGLPRHRPSHPREGPLRPWVPGRLLLARANRHRLHPHGRLRAAAGARGVGSRGGLHTRLGRARDRRADSAAEGRGEPLPLHGAASGTVWHRRLISPPLTEPPRSRILGSTPLLGSAKFGIALAQHSCTSQTTIPLLGINWCALCESVLILWGDAWRFVSC